MADAENNRRILVTLVTFFSQGSRSVTQLETHISWWDVSEAMKKLNWRDSGGTRGGGPPREQDKASRPVFSRGAEFHQARSFRSLYTHVYLFTYLPHYLSTTHPYIRRKWNHAEEKSFLFNSTKYQYSRPTARNGDCSIRFPDDHQTAERSFAPMTDTGTFPSAPAK